MKNKASAKKRLMFIQKEDYNYLAYNLLILLDTLGCSNSSKKFRDFRKIAYLVDFINEGGDVKRYDQRDLGIIYSRAQIKKKLLHHLLVILKNKGYIGLDLNTTYRSIDVWINKQNIPKDFFDKEVFKKEIENINQLKTQVWSLKAGNMKDLTDKIFKENNILTWEI
ncbi:hypothetical protein [Pedobacter frigoris]|uniref:Uncharacterized protein n=1 Tax=Pedobacter frigoris TaxID=2571272 RepID=A0A4U1CIY4_9SPHI|nr:hypothetical protein [Pedobacter frigoris]TKC06940.1 hypothetical protein FA047_06625 [Pedobacter frigoris]